MVALSAQRGRHGFTLVEMLVVIVIICILAGLLTPVISGTLLQAKITNCLHNQLQLYKLGTVYAVAHRGSWPPGKGEDLWISFRRLDPPLVEEDHAELLTCPAREEKCGPDETHFRGPAMPFGKLGVCDPLGADKPGNHGDRRGGNVLFKSGNAQEYELTHPKWVECDTKLTP